MNSGPSRSFRPSAAPTLALCLLAVLFASLGAWQARRAADKSALESQHRDAAHLPLAAALESDRRFAVVESYGRYDPTRHVLLDNQVWRGRGGVHVFTPFTTNGGTSVLVNRGWLPLAPDRKTLPDVPTPDGDVTLTGRLNLYPVPGRKVGAADRLQAGRWPQLVTYMEHADIEQALGLELAPRIVQLLPGEPHGFEGRDWQAAYMTSERHRGYALQWFAMTAACIVLWLATSFRRTPEMPA